MNWEEKLPWPEAGEVLFRDDLPDWHNNACFSLHGTWRRYSDAYLQAGRTLVQQVAEGHGLVDLLVYPIAFCYRHYLELTMKALIFDGSWLLDDAGKVLEGHRLKPLWDACRGLLIRIDAGCGPELASIDEKILQLEDVDPVGMAFRYPIDTQRKGGLPLLPEDLQRFNVRHFAEQIEQIGGFFSAAGDEIAARRDWKLEVTEWNEPSATSENALEQD